MAAVARVLAAHRRAQADARDPLVGALLVEGADPARVVVDQVRRPVTGRGQLNDLVRVAGKVERLLLGHQVVLLGQMTKGSPPSMTKSSSACSLSKMSRATRQSVVNCSGVPCQSSTNLNASAANSFAASLTATTVTTEP